MNNTYQLKFKRFKRTGIIDHTMKDVIYSLDNGLKGMRFGHGIVANIFVGKDITVTTTKKLMESFKAANKSSFRRIVKEIVGEIVSEKLKEANLYFTKEDIARMIPPASKFRDLSGRRGLWFSARDDYSLLFFRIDQATDFESMRWTFLWSNDEDKLSGGIAFYIEPF